VLVGSRIRASATLTQVEEVAGGVQTTMLITVEIEGGTKPACVIESISRYLT
jgi:acyl dehydratase